MLKVLIICMLLIAGNSAKVTKDPVDLVINTFCGDLDLNFSRTDAYVCTQKLASMVYLLYRRQEWMNAAADSGLNSALPAALAGPRPLLKRPSSSSQKLEEDEIKRNSIDALHGLTLG